MLKAVSGSFRIGRRRFPRPTLPLHVRLNTTTTIGVYASQRHDGSEEPEPVQVALSKSARAVEPPTATPFPFYYQSYSPQASTSKSTIPAPPPSNDVQQPAITSPSSSLSKRSRRARRYLHAVTISISKLSKSHLSRVAQAQRVHILLSKLASTLPTSEDTQGQAIYSYKYSQNFSDTFIDWLSSLLPPKNTTKATLAPLASTYLNILPVLFSNTENVSFKGDLNAIQEETFRLVNAIASTVPFEDICQLLSNSTPKHWLSLPSAILDSLADAVLHHDAACEILHSALPKTSPCNKRSLSKQARLHQLHRHLYEQQVNGQESFSRMFGPAPNRQSQYSGLKYILSSMILSEKLVKGDCSFNELKRPLALVRQFCNLYLPPDRQVMAAILQLAYLGNNDVRIELEQEGTFGWLWREWTVLRENEPDIEVDEILLVGFLEIAGHVAAFGKAVAGEDHHHENTFTLWIHQAYDIAHNKAALSFEVDKSATHYQIERDLPPVVNKRLLRSLAVTAMRLGHFDTSFACLFDSRLSSRHIVPVLHSLATTIDALGSTDSGLSNTLARAASEHLTPVAARIPSSLSAKHATQLADFIIVLTRNGHFTAAEAFLRVPRSPLHFGESNLRNIVAVSSKAGGAAMLQGLYQSLPASDWPASLLRSFIKSSLGQLSDIAWKDVTSRSDFESGRYLDARLQHHLRSHHLRYMMCKEEYQAAAGCFKSPPSPLTQLLLLDIHIRAGSGKRAIDLYDQLQEAGLAKQELDVRFLRIAGLPSRAGYRKRGPRSQLSRLGLHLDQLLSSGSALDSASAQYLVTQSLRWAELNDEAIWAILRSAMANASKLDWYRDLQPLVIAVKHAFRKRGNFEAETEVEQITSQVKRASLLKAK